MFYIIVAVLLIGITQGFIVIEAEFLIILASIIWVDAAGNIIKNLLSKEVEYKSDLIKEKYLWFFWKKKKWEEIILNESNKRLVVSNYRKNLAKKQLFEIIKKNTIYTNNNYIRLQEEAEKLIIVGIAVFKEKLKKEIIEISPTIIKNKIN